MSDLSSISPCPACDGGTFNDFPYPGSVCAPLLFDSITECGICGLGTAHPRLPQSTLDAFYASGAYWHTTGNSYAQIAHEFNQSRHRVLRCLPHLKTESPVADIGAGHGTIAEWLARLAGDRVLRYDFIEPDEINCEQIISRRTDFPLSAAKTIHDLGNDYALIFLNHVLEHVADPVDFLGAICARLRPGGIAYIETPHADHRFKGNVFPHTLFFTPRALEKLSAKLGLELLECAAFGAYPGTPGGMTPRFFRWASMAFHLAARARFGPMEQWLDDAIWQYQPKPDGMWLRCVLRRAPY